MRGVSSLPRHSFLYDPVLGHRIYITYMLCKCSGREPDHIEREGRRRVTTPAPLTGLDTAFSAGTQHSRVWGCNRDNKEDIRDVSLKVLFLG